MIFLKNTYIKILYKENSDQFEGVNPIDVKKNKIKANLEKLTSDFDQFKKNIENIERKNNTKDKVLLTQMRDWTKDQIKMNQDYVQNVLNYLDKTNDIYELRDCAVNVENHLKSKQKFMNDMKDLYRGTKQPKKQDQSIESKINGITKDLDSIKSTLENFEKYIKERKKANKPKKNSESWTALSQIENFIKAELKTNDRYTKETLKFLKKNNKPDEVSTVASDIKSLKDKIEKYIDNSKTLYDNKKNKENPNIELSHSSTNEIIFDRHTKF